VCGLGAGSFHALLVPCRQQKPRLGPSKRNALSSLFPIGGSAARATALFTVHVGEALHWLRSQSLLPVSFRLAASPMQAAALGTASQCRNNPVGSSSSDVMALRCTLRRVCPRPAIEGLAILEARLTAIAASPTEHMHIHLYVLCASAIARYMQYTQRRTDTPAALRSSQTASGTRERLAGERARRATSTRIYSTIELLSIDFQALQRGLP
jgi:hypothetical protein